MVLVCAACAAPEVFLAVIVRQGAMARAGLLGRAF
jgi:hypothetical protein